MQPKPLTTPSTWRLTVIGLTTLAIHQVGKAVTGLSYNLFADPFDIAKLTLSLTLWFVPFAVATWAVTRLSRSTYR